jgi:predicted transposase/invertase (TIGR01784 family)
MSRKLVSFDWAMKRILREKANFEILEGFLSELLKFDVKIQEILESEANQDSEIDRFNRVNMLVKNEQNELILIELQHNSEIDYFHRMIYGTSKLICQYIDSGEGYKQVKKVYSVNIVYFDLGQGDDYIYHGTNDFMGLNNQKSDLKLSTYQKNKFKKGEVFEIFPEYYIIKVNSFNDIAKNTIDEWIYFLKTEDIKDNFKAKGLEKAKEQLDYLKLPEEEKLKYQRRVENRMLEISLLDTAKFEGKMEGKIEGKMEGKIEIAKNLLDILDVETIAKKTGLSIEEIEELKKN